MNSPLEIQNGFRYFLKFYDFNTDWYEIPEPIGMDGAKFVKKQDDKGWARSVEYFAIDGLEFPNAYGIQLITPRAINPRGDISDHMDYGLQWLLSSRKKSGFEMKVEFKVTKFDVDFKVFELDTQDDDLTDGENYFKCKLVDIGLVADHKRNAENTFDAFSDKNVDGDTITPIDSFNYLIKATPLNLTSEWNLSGNFSLDAFFDGVEGVYLINPSQVLINSQINDTLLWLDQVYKTTSISDVNLFTLIKPVKDTRNIRVTFEVDFDYVIENNTPNVFFLNENLYIDSTFEHSAYEIISPPNSGVQTGTINQTFTYEIDVLDVGKRLNSCLVTIPFSGRSVSMFFRKRRIIVEAVETELDIVVPAFQYIDLLKQSGKFSNLLPTVAPRFDVNGEFYNQAVFNKAMVAGKKEFLITPKNVYESVEEVCGDVEISRERIFIGQYDEFYENKEIGSFLVIPSNDYKEPFDPSFGINNFTLGYDNFEKEKTVVGTSKSIHTKAEWSIKNKKRNAKKEIKLKFVRDCFDKQEMVNLQIKNPTTATDKDTKAYIEDMERLAPNASREFVRTLLMRWQGGFLEILNRNTLGTNDDAILNWNLIGTGIGASFEIVSGANVGVYTITDIKQNGSIIVLSPNTSVTQFTGNKTIRIKHYYTNVLWTTRTTQGFAVAPDGFSNLRYTIKRNMKHWYRYLASCLMYAKKDITCSEFLNNGAMETRLIGETVNLVERGDIKYSDLPTPLVEPILVKETIVAPFNDVLEYLDSYEHTKGFIRLYDPNGKVKRVFSKDFQYLLTSAKADIIGQKKYETEYLRIDVVGNEILIDDAPYNLQGIANWFETKNDEVQLYDEKSRPLSSWYDYNFVLLNGQQFSSMNSLVNALNAYEWI